MTTDVVVSIAGKLAAETDGQPDVETEELVCPGQYYNRNGSIFVLYDQLEPDFPNEPTHCVIKIRPDHVTLRKKGLVDTDMDFEIGKLNQTQYSTPLGTLILGFRAKTIEITEQPDEINVLIRYDMEREYTELIKCEINMNIKSVQQEENPS